jgi:hypothetical protein
LLFSTYPWLTKAFFARVGAALTIMFRWLNFVLPVCASPPFASIRFTLRRPASPPKHLPKSSTGTHIPPHPPNILLKKIHPYADIVNKNIITFIEETQHVASNYSVVECP